MSSLLSAVATVFSMDELVAEIGSHVDRQDLLQGCTVSKAWGRSAQSILFKEVKGLDGSGALHTGQILLLIKVLRGRPDLALLVKEANLSGVEYVASAIWGIIGRSGLGGWTVFLFKLCINLESVSLQGKSVDCSLTSPSLTLPSRRLRHAQPVSGPRPATTHPASPH